MPTSNLHTLYEKIEVEKELYNNAYYSYSRKNFYLVMPTIIITSVSSMLSFVSSSDIIPKEDKKMHWNWKWRIAFAFVFLISFFASACSQVGVIELDLFHVFLMYCDASHVGCCASNRDIIPFRASQDMN